MIIRGRWTSPGGSISKMIVRGCRSPREPGSRQQLLKSTFVLVRELGASILRISPRGPYDITALALLIMENVELRLIFECSTSSSHFLSKDFVSFGSYKSDGERVRAGFVNYETNAWDIEVLDRG